MIIIDHFSGFKFPINTIIGGVAASISTKALLATKLGISESEIRRFEIIGSDVHANIRSNYSMPGNAFFNDSALLSFLDNEGKVISLAAGVFRNTGLLHVNLPKVTTTLLASIGYNLDLTEIVLPEIINFGSQSLRGNSACKKIICLKLETIDFKENCFSGSTSLELLDLRKLKYYGSPASGNGATASGLSSLKTGCEIRVHEFMKTANSGTADLALIYAKTVRGATVNFYNDAGNYVSTL